MNKENIIWTPGCSNIVCTENAKNKGVMMYGVMMPEGEISRNRVLYEWNSVIRHHKDLIDRPVQFNHEIEGGDARTLGHYTKSDILTVGEVLYHPEYKILKDEIEKFNFLSTKRLWVYGADMDLQEEYYLNKIRRGDLRKVSIQLKANETSEAMDGNGDEYTLAIVNDIIEGSVVPAPGFLQTCAVLAEKYGGKKMKEKMVKVPLNQIPKIKARGIDILKTDTTHAYIDEEQRPELDSIGVDYSSEDVTTTTGDGAVAPTQPLEDEEKKDYKDYAIHKCETCGGNAFAHINGGYIQCLKCKAVMKNDTMQEQQESIPKDLPKDKQPQPAPSEDLETNYDLLAEKIVDELSEDFVLGMLEGVKKEKFARRDMVKAISYEIGPTAAIRITDEIMKLGSPSLGEIEKIISGHMSSIQTKRAMDTIKLIY